MAQSNRGDQLIANHSDMPEVPPEEHEDSECSECRIRVSVCGGAPPMSMVSDDFGLRYLIFHSFRERYTQAFISVVTYIMMPKFNGHPHHL